MNNFLKNLPEPILRLVLVFVFIIGSVLLIRHYIIPSSLKETGYQRTSAIEKEISREVHYVGSGVCSECHPELVSIKKDGYHRDLSCETCHGPAREHVDDPIENSPVIPRERSFCPLCHEYNLSRPTGFPQINPVAHNPLEPCVACHDPHDPVPQHVPEECSACHAEIARTKAVSPHVLLECITCHTVPEEHKATPRLFRPSIPSSRNFCGRCHGLESDVRKTPKIDLLTHGEKYLCWQCHYPHMPEVSQ